MPRVVYILVAILNYKYCVDLHIKNPRNILQKTERKLYGYCRRFYVRYLRYLSIYLRTLKPACIKRANMFSNIYM